METLQITKEAAVAAHDNAKKTGKKLLEDLFGKKTFQKDVTERIKTFDDVLKEEGYSRENWVRDTEYLSQDEIAYKKIKLIAKVLNEDWEPNWGNTNEYKYYPYFEITDASSSSGFGFSCRGWAPAYAYTRAYRGGRLCFKTRELAAYAGQQFEAIYKEFMV